MRVGFRGLVFLVLGGMFSTSFFSHASLIRYFSIDFDMYSYLTY